MRGDAEEGSRAGERLSDLAAFGLVAAATILTRLPFLDATNVGWDPDAWRVLLAAEHLAATGEYVASRFPGYPVHEIGSALVVGGGALALNALTALFSGLAVAWFGLILRRVGVRDWAWGAAAFAFTPVVFINSLVTMDYVWSVALVLGAWGAVQTERPVIAGCALGLAIGTRLTAAGFFLPLLWMLVREKPRGDVSALQRVIRFAGGTAVTALLCYLPALLAYGPDFLRFSDGRPPLHVAMHHATLEVWGVLGFLGLAGAIVTGLVRRRQLERRERIVEVAALVGIAIFGVAFARLPLESGYLIPVVPLVLFVLALRVPGLAFRGLCLMLIASPFLLDLEAESSLPPPLDSAGVEIHVGGSEMRLVPLGPLFTERARMEATTARLDSLAARVETVPRPAIVLAGGFWTRLAGTLGDRRHGYVFADSLGALGPAGAGDPLRALWPGADSLARLPVFALPEASSPDPADPRLAGRGVHPVP